MMENKNKYFQISYEKELIDSKSLIEKIKASGWISTEMVIVNCFPDYSSRLTQLVNHKLSFLNANDLFEVIDLQMPYPNMTQVWNPCDRKYQAFYNYMSDWARTNLFSTSKYLFVSAGENLSSIRPFMKVKLEPDDYKFATLYSKVTDPEPDFWIEKYERQLLFEWENMDNPNWKITK
jgi:hypothetical protein